MKDISHLSKDLNFTITKLTRELTDDIPRDIGIIHVEGFKDSFRKQRFNDDNAPAWQEVKRRIPTSKWYGFDYNRDRKNKSRSPAARTRAILRGPGSQGLQSGIYLRVANSRMISIASDTKYAIYHNEGDPNHKIFGRGKSYMPKRQFMGHSNVLDRRSEQLIDRRINKAFRNI